MQGNNAACAQYGCPTPTPTTTTTAVPPRPHPTPPPAELPFTGFWLPLVVLIGCLLVCFGVVIRSLIKR